MNTGMLALLFVLAARPAAAGLDIRVVDSFAASPCGRAWSSVADGSADDDALRKAEKCPASVLKSMALERRVESALSQGDVRKARKWLERRGPGPRPGPGLSEYEYSRRLLGLLQGSAVPPGDADARNGLLWGIWSFRQGRWGDAAAGFEAAAALPQELGVKAQLNLAGARLRTGANGPCVGTAVMGHKVFGSWARLVEAGLLVRTDPQRALELAEGIAPRDPLSPVAQLLAKDAYRVGGMSNEAIAGFTDLAQSSGVPAGVRAAAAARLIAMLKPYEPGWGEAVGVLDAALAPAQQPWKAFLLGSRLRGLPESPVQFLEGARLGSGLIRSANIYFAAKDLAVDDAASWARARRYLSESVKEPWDPFKTWASLASARHYVLSRQPAAALRGLNTLLASGAVGIAEVAPRAIAFDVMAEAQYANGDREGAYETSRSSALPLYLQQEVVRPLVRDPRKIMASLEYNQRAKAVLLDEMYASHPEQGCDELLAGAAARLKAGDPEGAWSLAGLPAANCAPGWRDLVKGESLYRMGISSEAAGYAQLAFGALRPCTPEWKAAGQLAMTGMAAAKLEAGGAAYGRTGRSLADGCSSRGLWDLATGRDWMASIAAVASSSGSLAGSALEFLRYATARGDALGVAASEAAGRVAFRKGEWAEAARLLGRSAEPEAQALRGQAFLESKRWAAAVEAFSGVLPAGKGRVSHLTLKSRIDMAFALARLGRFDEAQRQLERVLKEAKPVEFKMEAALAAQEMAAILHKLGRPGDALAYLKRAEDEENPDADQVPRQQLAAAALAGRGDEVVSAYGRIGRQGEPDLEESVRYCEALAARDPGRAGQGLLDLLPRVKETIRRRRLELRAHDFLAEAERRTIRIAEIGR